MGGKNEGVLASCTAHSVARQTAARISVMWEPARTGADVLTPTAFSAWRKHIAHGPDRIQTRKRAETVYRPGSRGRLEVGYRTAKYCSCSVKLFSFAFPSHIPIYRCILICLSLSLSSTPSCTLCCPSFLSLPLSWILSKLLFFPSMPSCHTGYGLSNKQGAWPLGQSVLPNWSRFDHGLEASQIAAGSPRPEKTGQNFRNC